ncbi:hypothetical protein FDP41_003132 [Naegleria fowleri]|uniref:DnaJ-like protein C11 C-terminal domain-containing protein n=1 Tax=Naegleria fowleri TaxID=5763 RepID=A0A6A5BVP8_NAEFO|nr:uncharacterized protein FDP41_003132 [Naegleria fowleri]KAF0977810.1 hypothetical protein FDP41_003132 [Naegleria fowleri]CAG4712426.1 unnamed protein product [Naegleria fowleri]
MTVVALLGVVALFYYLYKAFFTSWNKTFDYSDEDKEFWDHRISEAINNCTAISNSARLTKSSSTSEKVFKELGSAWSEEDRIKFVENKKKIQLKQKKLDHLFLQIKEREKRKDGLVIINARYGVFNPPDFRALVNVTVPLQCFVNSKSSTIVIKKEMSMSSLPGFGDPLEGFINNYVQHLNKELQVIYRTNGSLKMKTFIENEQGFEVTLPFEGQ